MKLEGRYTLNAPRDVVWEALLDPAVIASTVPGAADLEPVGDHEYRGMLKFGIGPVQGKFKGTVQIHDRVPPESYRLKMKGQGAVGFVEGEGTIRLTDRGADTTLDYEIEVKLGGKLAAIGQRLFGSAAESLSAQALESLNEQVKARARAAGDR